MKLRWKIAILVAVAIAISYLDRQTLPVAIKAISKDIPITDTGYARLQSAFLIAYGLMYAVGGKLLDVLGTRRGFALVMVFWSLACASHGLATTIEMLVISRLLLGIGEGGGFPAATRAMAEWFPVRERSTAMGVINVGTAVGGAIAPPLIALILSYSQWPTIFVLTGMLGLLWVGWWWLAYFPPEQHRGISSAERHELSEVLAATHHTAPAPSWFQLLRYYQVWGIMLAKFVSDGAWYFFAFWLPKYLFSARGLDIKEVGTFAWIPFVGAGVGCLVGGSLSSWLLRRNFRLDSARKIALAVSAALMPAIAFAPHVPIPAVVALYTLAYFGHQWWSTLMMTLPADLFPKRTVGAVAGLIGCAGALGGVAFGELVGYLLDQGYGYNLVFALAGSFHVVSFIVICITVPTIRPLTVEPPSPKVEQ